MLFHTWLVSGLASDRVVDLHHPWEWDMEWGAGRFTDWARAYPGRVMLQQPHPDIPQSEAYPLTDVQAHFGQHGQPETCFDNSLCYLLALALFEGFDAIDLVGVLMRDREEYRHERAGVQYWIGRARGMGVTVTVPADSGLCQSPRLYGYDLQNKNVPECPGELRAFWGQPGECADEQHHRQ